MSMVATCPACNKTYVPVLVKDEAGMKRWQNGELIQNVWPGSKPIHREQLQTGICSDKCWDRFLGTGPDS
jgi:hypothetical protein